MSALKSVRKIITKLPKTNLPLQIKLTEEDKKQLGYQIGFDPDKDHQRYGWVIDLMINSELPPGVEKERDFEGNLVFYNRIENTTTPLHPNHLEYRKILKNTIAQHQNQKTIDIQGMINSNNYLEILALSEEDKHKYEVQKERIKQIEKFKKRSLEDSSPKKNKNGKFSTPMNEMRPPNKLNPDQVQIKILDKNAKQRLRSINKKDRFRENGYEIANDQIQDEVILETTAYYIKTFGLIVNKIRHWMNQFVNSPDYNMEYVEKLAHHYKIDIQREPHLLWIPRVLINLPLPPNWRKISDEIYQNTFEPDIILDFHPAEPFIQIYLRKARNFYKNHPDKIKDLPALQLYDQLMRKHNMNSRMMTKRETMEQVEFLKDDLEDKVMNYMEKGLTQRSKHITYDIEIMEVASLCEIDLIKEIHLLKVIEEVLNENKQSGLKWEYREVKEKLNVVRSLNEKYKDEIELNHINQPQDISQLFKGLAGQQLFQTCKTERQMASDQLFRNLMFKENPQYFDDQFEQQQQNLELDMDEENNNHYRSRLKEILENTIHKKIPKNELFDILFFNPFKLLDNANLLSNIELPENIDLNISRQSNTSKHRKEDLMVRTILDIRKQDSQNKQEESMSKKSNKQNTEEKNGVKSKKGLFRGRKSIRQLFKSNMDFDSTHQIDKLKSDPELHHYATLNQSEINDIMSSRNEQNKEKKIEQFIQNNKDMDPNQLEKFVKLFRQTQLARDFIKVLRGQKKQDLLDHDQQLQESLTKKQKQVEEENMNTYKNYTDLPNLKNIILTMNMPRQENNELTPFASRSYLKPLDSFGSYHQRRDSSAMLKNGDADSQNSRRFSHLFKTIAPPDLDGILNMKSLTRTDVEKDDEWQLTEYFKTISPSKQYGRKVTLDDLKKQNQFENQNSNSGENTRKSVQIHISRFPTSIQIDNFNDQGQTLDEKGQQNLGAGLQSKYFFQSNNDDLLDKQDTLPIRMPSVIFQTQDEKNLNLKQLTEQKEEIPLKQQKSRNHRTSSRQICLTHRVFLGDVEEKKLQYKQKLGIKFYDKIKKIRNDQLEKILSDSKNKEFETTNSQTIVVPQLTLSHFEKGNQTTINADRAFAPLKFCQTIENFKINHDAYLSLGQTSRKNIHAHNQEGLNTRANTSYKRVFSQKNLQQAWMIKQQCSKFQLETQDFKSKIDKIQYFRQLKFFKFHTIEIFIFKSIVKLILNFKYRVRS
ncbi:UNKNOWN [Stylonychia lemnae]|uniref:Uncharacterized protein n=1 Tax=Stylonychia lemnae TaxID=5949 RepID=A0A077ZZJ0_STYLE|nr:UNKNOWN [Stylonychia lemnae]|eukprot:CDW73938.1 UNKNOWN [Stylonychia lemnae]